MTEYTRDAPPNFPLKREGKRRFTEYPNRGVKTGPAWRAMWQLLCDAPGPVVGDDLDFVGAAAGSCSPWTAKLLLTRARAAGLLHRDYQLINSRARVVYHLAARAGEMSWDQVVSQDWVLDWMLGGNQRLRDAALAERARAS